jgi:hypothetical protein
MSPDEYERSFKEIAKHALTLRAIRDDKDPNSPAVAKEIEQEATRISALNADPAPAAATRLHPSTGRLKPLRKRQA